MKAKLTGHIEKFYNNNKFPLVYCHNWRYINTCFIHLKDLNKPVFRRAHVAPAKAKHDRRTNSDPYVALCFAGTTQMKDKHSWCSMVGIIMNKCSNSHHKYKPQFFGRQIWLWSHKISVYQNHHFNHVNRTSAIDMYFLSNMSIWCKITLHVACVNYIIYITYSNMHN